MNSKTLQNNVEVEFVESFFDKINESLNINVFEL